MLTLCRTVLVLLLAGASLAVGQELKQQYLGVASCQSSGCHGGGLRGEALIWKDKDIHTRRPLAILTTARSQRIAETLHLGEATKSARCTVCHAPFQALAPQAKSKIVQSDEVFSCETCHGPAESWIRSHTRPDFKYQNRLAVGMRDVKGVYARANNCVACHENIEPALLDAGHPELVFELSGKTVSEPPHWTQETDWVGVREWLTGQAVALREVSWQLTKANDPRSLARWKGLSWLLHHVSAQVPAVPQVSEPGANPGTGDFSNMQSLSDRVARAAAELSWSADKSRALLDKLASLDGSFAAAGDLLEQAHQAEALVQALDRLAVSLRDKEKYVLKDEAFRALDKLFEDVRFPPDFKVAQFTAHLREFREKL